VPLPVLPALGIDEPLLEGDGAVEGEDEGEVVVLPLVLAPAPALARFARRQSSRCVPVRPTHCEGVVAPAPAVSEVVLLPGAVEVRLSVLDDAPDEPPEPELEPDDCANAADDRASSAAAVVAASVLSIMFWIS
jgi:hypothetical protein